MALIPNKTTGHKDPKIDRMLTLSTYHLTPRTNKELIEWKPDFKTIACTMVNAGPWYGLFVKIGDHPDNEYDDELPDDLFNAVMFARSRHCSVIYFSPTADPIPHLKYYYDIETRYEGEDA